MANTIGFGQGAVNNNIGWGKASLNNSIGYGAIEAESWSPETNLTGSSGGFADTQSLIYDGVDDYQESAGTWSTIDGATNFSVSVWVKATLGSVSMIAKSYGTGTASNFYIYVAANGQVNVWSANSSSNWSRSTTLLTDGVWHHIVMTLDRSIPDRYTMQKIYVDGIEGFTSNYYGGSIPTGTTLGIGANYNYTLPQYLYPANAKINEFAVWGGYTLSPTEITEIYNNGVANDLTALPTAPSPTNWYREESAVWNGTYYETADEMGAAPSLTTRNMAQASRVSDVPQFQTFSTLFDGVDDYVDTNATLVGTTFSISAWFKVANTTDHQSIFSTRENTISISRGVDVYIQSDVLTFRIYNNGGTAVTQAFTDLGWNHVLYVYDGTTLEGFLNGVSIGSVTASYATSSESLKFGHFVPSVTYAEANIDEVALFYSDESANVSTIYNSGIPNDISALSPNGWWRMGDGDVYPTLNDRGSGGNNGTMNNMSSANFVTDIP